MSSPRKRMHLTGFMLYGPAPHMLMSWVYPEAEMYAGRWHEPRYWTSIAQTLERGCFDMLFFVDGWSGGTNVPSKRYAIQFPTHDPLTLAPYLAARTRQLGYAVTMSTSFYQPFMLARKLSSLDHVTEGRIGWNIVCSIGDGEARNFGMDRLPEHDERYDRADEFMECVNQLWNSWDEDAVLMDMESGVFANPEKIRKVDFEGRWFSCQGPLNVAPSPQRRPYIIQAGASDRGREFAARHAECIFGAATGVGQMREFCEDIYARAERLGRDPSRIRIIWIAQPLVAQSAEEARERHIAIRERIPLEAKLALVAGHLNINLRNVDIDAPAGNLAVEGTRGMLESYTARRPEISLREIAESYLSGTDDSRFVGTPIDVADYMEYLIEEGGGDGFQVTPTFYAPAYYEHIVEHLIPELQNRGAVRTAYEGRTLRDYMSER